MNRGQLGPKGLHDWVVCNAPDRPTRPLLRRDGELVETSWDEAMDLVVRNGARVIEAKTAHGLGLHSTGQFLLEEYNILAVIGKAGLGTSHVDGNTRLCMATAARALGGELGHRRRGVLLR